MKTASLQLWRGPNMYPLDWIHVWTHPIKKVYGEKISKLKIQTLIAKS
jgi:hypothetical protein